MEIKTFRARSMHEALDLVRKELGPQASVLHTREVRGRGLMRFVPGWRQIEVTASPDVQVPSRLPPRKTEPAPAPSAPPPLAPPAHRLSPAGEKTPTPDELQGQLGQLRAMLSDLCQRSGGAGFGDLPEQLFHIYTDLIDADIDETVARGLVERVRGELAEHELADTRLVRQRLTAIIESEIHVRGSIQVTPGKRRLVALVGPTGVGKTTTIAKLAANYRLREKVNVGLITVDTYRIAAVEQLRTYADIIDLPMQVVATPREMREAVRRLSDLDLVLIDTAGRSPRDEVQIQELKAMLGEANADEVHLVLSSVASASSLRKTAEHFRTAGTTALVLTKLDEAAGLGNLLPLLRSANLPLSYLTNGQNVPDDIEPAAAKKLARMILGEL